MYYIQDDASLDSLLLETFSVTLTDNVILDKRVKRHNFRLSQFDVYVNNYSGD